MVVGALDQSAVAVRRALWREHGVEAPDVRSGRGPAAPRQTPRRMR